MGISQEFLYEFLLRFSEFKIHVTFQLLRHTYIMYFRCEMSIHPSFGWYSSNKQSLLSLNAQIHLCVCACFVKKEPSTKNGYLSNQPVYAVYTTHTQSCHIIMVSSLIYISSSSLSNGFKPLAVGILYFVSIHNIVYVLCIVFSSLPQIYELLFLPHDLISWKG